MTICAEFRDGLLAADPSILRGEGDDRLARHVRSCASCAAAARLFLEGADALDHALAEDLPPLDTGAVLRRARSIEPAPRRRLLPGVAGLAAAAVAAALWLLPGAEPPPGGQRHTAAVPLPLVEDASGDVAVLPTTHPDITVLWFF